MLQILLNLLPILVMRRRRNQSITLSSIIVSFFWFLCSTKTFWIQQQQQQVSSIVVEAVVLSPSDEGNEGKCKILGFFPTQTMPEEEEGNDNSNNQYHRWTKEEVERVSKSMIATAYLAVEHFHSRNTIIVKELGNLPQEECTVELDLIVNTEYLTTKRAGQIMIEEATELCAFLGSYDADVARAMQPTSAALDIPQVIYYTHDQFLTSSKRPSAIGLPPTVLPLARVLAEYLNSAPIEVLPPRKYTQLVYEEAYISSYLSQCFEEDAASKYGLESAKYQDDHLGIIPTLTPEQLQRNILKEVHDSGVGTIILNKLQSSSLNLTAHILDDYGMLTDDYLYVFRAQALPTDAVGQIFGPLEKDSPLDRLLRGGLVIDYIDPFRGSSPISDPFLNMWKKLNSSTTIANIVDKYPEFHDLFMMKENNEEDYTYFQTVVPADYSAFLYDAIMSIGMGACYATVTKPSKGNDTDTTFTTFRQDIRQTDFTGASGRVDWSGCKYKSNRCNEPIKFGIFNIQAIPVDEEGGEGIRHTYKTVLTAEWDIENRWQKVGDNIYRDGTTQAPTKLRAESESNYLSTGVRRFGLFLFASSFSVSAVCLIAVGLLRNEPYVVRGQPAFLALLCLGSLLLSCAIFTLSIDEMVTTNPSGLDAGCALSVWFFFVGHILSFTALFCKIRRLDKVTTPFRRNAVMTTGRALLPLFAFLLLTVSILAAWNAMDPWTWEREIMSMIPFETYGSCKSQNFWAYFGSLMGVLVLAKGLVLFYVWRTMGRVDDSFNDNRHSVYAIATQMQAWVIGVPILAVLGTGESVDAIYLGRSLLIWIFSISGVGFVVGTKIYRTTRSLMNPPLCREHRIHISGINNNPPESTRSSSRGDLLRQSGGTTSRRSHTEGNNDFDDDVTGSGRVRHPSEGLLTPCSFRQHKTASESITTECVSERNEPVAPGLSTKQPMS